MISMPVNEQKLQVDETTGDDVTGDDTGKSAVSHEIGPAEDSALLDYIEQVGELSETLKLPQPELFESEKRGSSNDRGAADSALLNQMEALGEHEDLDESNQLELSESTKRRRRDTVADSALLNRVEQMGELKETELDTQALFESGKGGGGTEANERVSSLLDRVEHLAETAESK